MEQTNAEFKDGIARIEEQLAKLVTLLSKPDLNSILVKSHYSCAEVAKLTQLAFLEFHYA